MYKACTYKYSYFEWNGVAYSEEVSLALRSQRILTAASEINISTFRRCNWWNIYMSMKSLKQLPPLSRLRNMHITIVYKLNQSIHPFMSLQKHWQLAHMHNAVNLQKYWEYSAHKWTGGVRCSSRRVVFTGAGLSSVTLLLCGLSALARNLCTLQKFIATQS